MNITKLKLRTSAEQQMPGMCQQSWSSLAGARRGGRITEGLWIEHFDLELLCNELPLILRQVCEPELLPRCTHFWEEILGTGAGLVVVVPFSLGWWSFGPLQNLFLVVSAHRGAHNMSIVGFVYLLFSRYWSADKNTIENAFCAFCWVALGWETPSLDRNLVSKACSMVFKITKSPVLSGSWSIFTYLTVLAGDMFVILFLLIWEFNQQGLLQQ